MQAIMAAAIAFDALYAMIKTRVESASTAKEGRGRRPKRFSQVAEEIKQAFHLKSESEGDLRKRLKEIYDFRDRAVHPPAEMEAPVVHPELGVGVEWRFVAFSAHNAERIVNATSLIFWELAHDGKPTRPQIQKYVEALRPRLAELFPDTKPA